MSTKTAATKTETVKAERVIKAGGDKGKAVVEALTAEPGLTRAQLAEKVGCTTGRVGEVVRFLATNGSDAEKALIQKHRDAQPARKAPAAKTAEAKPAAKTATAKKAAAAKPRPTTAAKSRARKSSTPKA